MLTATAILNAKPGKRPRRLYDAGGMYLEVSPTGGRWWRLAYRFNGKRKLFSLGVHPDVSLQSARKKRDAARDLLANGIDPSAKRRADKREAAARDTNSFKAVAAEWYKRQAHTWVASHASDVKRRLEGDLYPEIGATPISELTAPALLATVRKIEHRGAHDLAHRVLQVCGQVLRFGIATGRCERDLSRDLRGALTPHKAKNQPAVTPDELPALLRAIDGYAERGDKITMLALRMMSLTFVRTGELINATWSEIDLAGAMWIVPAERMKMKAQHVVPLSRKAVEALRELESIGGGSRYVFPGRNIDKPISNNTVLFALYRMGYKGKMTGHGFRGVASTILNESGFHADVIERQLAHAERNDIRRAYNRAAYLPERVAMMQRWSDMLDAMKRGAQVIPLQRKA